MRNKMLTVFAIGATLLLLIAACGGTTSTGNTQAPIATENPTATPVSEPTAPEPTDPAPTDPAPTDPAPTDPAPTDPAPTDPAPTDPAPTEPAPTDPAPTNPVPTDPAPGEMEMIDTPAPIEAVKVVVSDVEPTQYNLEIVSGLPSGCAKFDDYATLIDGNTITVTVTNLMPAGPVPCTTIYGYHERVVSLGNDLTPGETYTVVVNGQLTNAFTPPT